MEGERPVDGHLDGVFGEAAAREAAAHWGYSRDAQLRSALRLRERHLSRSATRAAGERPCCG